MQRWGYICLQTKKTASLKLFSEISFKALIYKSSVQASQLNQEKESLFQMD